jgi:hypothetical protein
MVSELLRFRDGRLTEESDVLWLLGDARTGHTGYHPRATVFSLVERRRKPLFCSMEMCVQTLAIAIFTGPRSKPTCNCVLLVNCDFLALALRGFFDALGIVFQVAV